MTANWSCPDGELVLSVEDGKDRDRWLAERRKGIGGSDMAALMGEPKYNTEYDVWLAKTGRGAEVEQTLQMELGSRWEDAVAEKFAEDAGLEIRRRGLMRHKHQPLIIGNTDRLVSDGGGLECKAVNGFTKMPSDRDYRGGVRADWYWQMLTYLLVSGRSHWYLAVAIGNHDFQTRVLYRDDPQVQHDMQLILTRVPTWWFTHVMGDVAPEFAGMPDLSEVAECSKYEAIIPGLLVEQRDRLREIRETKRALAEEEKDLKAKLEAEAGGAEWLLADGRPLLHFNPVKGRSSFKKADLFKREPLDGVALVEWLQKNQETVEYEYLPSILDQFLLTEAQFTSTGKPSKSLLIVGGDDDD